MTLKERVKAAGSSLAKYKTACASAVRAKVRRRKPRVASTTPETSKQPPRFARKYIIIAVATAIVGICAIALIRKGPPIATLRAKAATLFSRKKSHTQPPASKLAQAPAPKPAEAPAHKTAEPSAPKLADAPAHKTAEPSTPKLAAISLVSERMVRSCEDLAKPRLAAASSTGADVYAVAVCKQFGLWKQVQPTLQRSD